MKKNEEKKSIEQEKNSVPKTESRQVIITSKHDQELLEEKKNIIDKVLEAIKNRTCHAC